jgi:hypothetical protein
LEIQIAVELFVQETEFASNLLLKNSEWVFKFIYLSNTSIRWT